MFILITPRSFPARDTAWLFYSLMVVNTAVFLATWVPFAIADGFV
jgi:hypothetical protein